MNNTEDNNLDLIFESPVRGPGPIRGDICIVDLGDKVDVDEWDYVLRGRRPCIVLKTVGLRVEILPLTKNPIYDTGFSIQIPNSAYKSYPRYDNIMPVNRAKLSVMAPYNGANIITTYGIDVFNSIIDRIANYFKSDDKLFAEKKEDCAHVHNPVTSDYKPKVCYSPPVKINNEVESSLPTLPIAPENKSAYKKSPKVAKPKKAVRMDSQQVYNAPLCVKKLIDKYGDSFVLNGIQTMDSVSSAEVFGVSSSTNARVRKYFNDIGITPKGYTDRREPITKEERDNAIVMINNGASVRSVADKLNVSVNAVYKIIHK